ncbi:MAG: HNH endonuclease signature motif containing protein [Myxococcota bacterium]
MREVSGFPGYRVTSDGEILSKKTGRPLKPWAHQRTGHLRVRLYGPQLDPVAVTVGASVQQWRMRNAYVHVLVCTAWHGPPPFEGALVLHWDDDPTNNRPDNLRWGTRKENAEDFARNNSLDDDGFDWSVGAWRDAGPLFAGVAS